MTLAIRATATSLGFKWDASWGGGKSDVIEHRPPSLPFDGAPGPGRWKAPAVETLSVRATAAGWGSKFDTYMALDHVESIGHLAPRLPALNAAGPGAQATLAGASDHRGWERPAVKALSIRATATSWGFTWDSGWGGQKSSSVGHLPPEDTAKDAPAPMVTQAHRSDRGWEAPAVDALPVAATASSLGIKWDLYMGGGKMQAGPQSPPKHEAGIKGDGAVARAAHSGEPRNWEAPAVTALAVRFTARTGG